MRRSRRLEDADLAEGLPGGASPEQHLERQERALAAPEVEEALQVALNALDYQDRLILRMHYLDKIQLSEISRVLKVPQKSLYRQKDRALAVLRSALEARGIARERVSWLLDSETTELGSRGDIRRKSFAGDQW